MTDLRMIRTRQATELDAVPVVMMAHALAHYHGDMAKLKLNSFLNDACGDDPRCHVFVVEDRTGTIAGFAACYFTYEFHHGIRGLEIQNFFIRDEFRGQNLGRKLLKDVVAFALERRCARVSLGAESSNQGAILFYTRMGFEKGKTGGDVQRFRLEGENLRKFMESNYD